MSSFHLDFERTGRVGFPEIVYGESKTVAQLEAIITTFLEETGRVFITKLSEAKANNITLKFDRTSYDPLSRSLLVGDFPESLYEGQVAVLSGGTSDEYLVNEVYYTLKFLGHTADRFQDVGVSGLHRLQGHTKHLKKFRVLIVIAGFEGALPTIVGGLFPQPVIAVPASVGYGVSAGGMAALNAMLSSCANGITVVNIDNGYGAAIAAFRILKQYNKS